MQGVKVGLQGAGASLDHLFPLWLVCPGPLAFPHTLANSGSPAEEPGKEEGDIYLPEIHSVP